MRLSLLSAAIAVISFTAAATSLAQSPSGLSPEEQKAGFELLFNGENLDGWSHKGNWTVEDGVITRNGSGGSLVYTEAKVPDDFDLRFEWKVGEGSNSGVYYRPTQYEYQILDNAVHKDGKNPRTSAASLYFCVQPSHDNTKPVGQWNTARIVCKGTVIQHWLNGEKVIHLDYADPKWKWHVDLLKARGGDLTARGANLNLQDHGDPVWYRNLRMRELSADDKIDMTPVEPEEISEEVLKAERIKLQGIVERRKKNATSSTAPVDFWRAANTNCPSLYLESVALADTKRLDLERRLHAYHEPSNQLRCPQKHGCFDFAGIRHLVRRMRPYGRNCKAVKKCRRPPSAFRNC